MKRIAVAAMIILMTGSTAFAAFWGKDDSAKSEPAKKIVIQKKVVNTEEAAEKQKAELMGKEWTVALTPMGGRGKAETDIISFAENKVASKNLQTAGYVPTNFTVRLQEDGTVTWETMQSSEKDGMAFWRGDIKDGVMHGVLSKRDRRNNTADFSFTSVAK